MASPEKNNGSAATPGITMISTDSPQNEQLADAAGDTTDTADDKNEKGNNAVGSSTNEDTSKQQYMTGMPFVITFGSLMLATLLSALNASMLSTVGLKTSKGRYQRSF